MNPKTVRKLEDKIEKAIAEAVVDIGLKKLPLMPSGHTFQMMAKAAVAVYEAAAERRHRRFRRAMPSCGDIGSNSDRKSER
jgi:hypothetical protein